MPISSHADLQVLHDPVLEDLGIQLRVLRLDTLFPFSAGNKFFKLEKNIVYAQSAGFKNIASFGGAYSNHIHALALAGKAEGLRTIGFIRGEPHCPLNETLQDVSDAGMTLHYLDRSTYKKRNDSDFLLELSAQFPDTYFIPEGGSNALGVAGCMDIVNHIEHHIGDDYDLITVPCGTAATLAGIAASVPNKEVLGFSVLKNSIYLEDEVRRFHAEMNVDNVNNWSLCHDFHCGGYAKVNDELMMFLQEFERKFSIPLEPIYSGKMFYGLYDLLMRRSRESLSSTFNEGTKIVAIHTGGIQGLRGIQPIINKIASKAVA